MTNDPQHSAPSTQHSLYRTFAAADEGGKTIQVFPGADGDLQAQASQAGAPMSVFVEESDTVSVKLRVFTPTREKDGSESAAVAALTHLNASQPMSDIVHVFMGGEDLPAQLCGGEWLLRQGEVDVAEVDADLAGIGPHVRQAWQALTERPNLIVEVENLAALDAFEPDAEAVANLGRATSTTGFILFTMGGPGRVDVSFRAFGPLKGFLEDAASSNMLACLVGVLGHLGRLPGDSNLLRAAQRMPGQPARLTAQFNTADSGKTEVWVGGTSSLLLSFAGSV